MIIGICGHKGSGKDYLANILKEYTGFKVVHFADPIKDILCDLFKISKDELNKLKNSEDSKILGTNMRSILQVFGTNIMQRFCGKRIWVDLVLKEDNLIMYFLKFEILVKQRTKSSTTRIKNNIKLCSIVKRTTNSLNL